MKLDEGDLLASGAELVASAAVMGVAVGDLARIPRVASKESDQHAVESFFEEVSEDFGEYYKAALKTLANPSRIGVMHYSLGEESISRAILAWGPATGNHIVMMISDGGWRIRVESVESLAKTVSSVLLDQVPLQTVDIRCTVAQESALVLLAALHLLRESRLMALLSHRQAPTAFTMEGVEEVLDDSAKEDFRWPFYFLDKVLPFSTNGVVWSDTIPESLKELAGKELVEEVSESEGSTWQLTESGYRLALANHHHLTKVGLRITELGIDGGKGHEGMLFVRSLQDLFVYDLGGSEAAIASLSRDDMTVLVTDFLSLEKPSFEEEEVPDKAGKAEKKGSQSCPACGESVAAKMKFCSSCGMDMAGGDEAGTEPARASESVPAGKLGKAPPPVPKKRERVEVEPTPVKREPEKRPSPEQHPKFCNQCGGALSATDKFCKGCGGKVGE